MDTRSYGTYRWHEDRLVYTGSFFCNGVHGATRTRTFRVNLPPSQDRLCLLNISNTMLSAVGDFDENDTIFVDIYAVDGKRMDTSNGYGGVWGRHFGSYGSSSNQSISAYVGKVQENVAFRIAITGDDWAGASFIIMEL